MTAITGLNIQLTVGGFTVNRLPYGELRSERGAIAGRLRLELPDPKGQLASELKKDDPVIQIPSPGAVCPAIVM